MSEAQTYLNKKAPPDLDTMVRRVDNISTIPTVAMRVIDVANDPNSGAADLKQAIEGDVSLAAIGIPPEASSRIFDPFYTTKEVGRGTGQGLAVGHSVVTQKHGGTINFETESGEGTTFIIRLPIEQDSPSRAGV